MSSEPLRVYLRTAHDTPFAREALDSILAQSDTQLRLLVIEDGHSALPVASGDPRVSVIRNRKRLGGLRCRALMLEATTESLIVEVSPHGIVLPGGLQGLLDGLREESGVVHSRYFETDRDGRLQLDEHRLLHEYFRSLTDVRAELLGRGAMIGPLRLFRRSALESARGSSSELEVMLRIIDRFSIDLVNDYLFEMRPAPQASLIRSLVTGIRDVAVSRRYLGDGSANTLLLIRLRRACRIDRMIAPLHRARGIVRRRVRLIRMRIAESIYYSALQRFSRLAPRLLPSPRRGVESRLAYSVWRFPILSQTFVHRELAALRASGLDFDILAEEAETEPADHNASRLMERAHFLPPVNGRHLRRFWLAKPLGTLRVLLFILLCRYARQKNAGMDWNELARAAHLAAAFQSRGIGHIHSPWADRSALVTLMAARLIGATWSVQVRAHELHRGSEPYGLREMLRAASFIVTNTAYNRTHLTSLLGSSADIQVIHNGIDLEHFEPPPRRDGRGRKILCVARLIEQKGLTHLLEACALLRDRGIDFECTIVGAPEEPLYTNYYLELRRLRHRLRLEHHVNFLGALPFREVLRLHAETDVFTLPCVIAADGARDIIPNAVLEAMAMARPVVTTAIGGVPEMVEDGVSGVLVRSADPVVLADALESLLGDGERRARLGDAARARIEEKFDISRNVAGYVRLFRAMRPFEEIDPVIGDSAFSPES
jgi:glycosyltransferase involved in cell wall biosynthesis